MVIQKLMVHDPVKKNVYDDGKECWILGRLESMGLKDISDEGG